MLDFAFDNFAIFNRFNVVSIGPIARNIFLTKIIFLRLKSFNQNIVIAIIIKNNFIKIIAPNIDWQIHAPIIFISLGVIIILVIIGSLTKAERSGIASANEVNNLDSSDNINKTPLSSDNINKTPLSSDNVTSDTTRILTDPDLSKDIKPSKRYSDVGPTPWTSSTKNYSITVNGKILQVADCDMPGGSTFEQYKFAANLYGCEEAGSAVDALGNGWRFPTREEFVQINQQLRLKGMGSFDAEICYFYRTKNYRPLTHGNGQVIKIDATWCWDNYHEGSVMDDDGTLWSIACVAGDGGAGKIRVVREN